MAEFETSAEVEIGVSQRSLSNARRQIESELGGIEVGVSVSGGGGGRQPRDPQTGQFMQRQGAEQRLVELNETLSQSLTGDDNDRRRRREFRWARQRTRNTDDMVDLLGQINEEVAEFEGEGGGVSGTILGGLGTVTGGIGAGAAGFSAAGIAGGLGVRELVPDAPDEPLFERMDEDGLEGIIRSQINPLEWNVPAEDALVEMITGRRVEDLIWQPPGPGEFVSDIVSDRVDPLEWQIPSVDDLIGMARDELFGDRGADDDTDRTGPQPGDSPGRFNTLREQLRGPNGSGGRFNTLEEQRAGPSEISANVQTGETSVNVNADVENVVDRAISNMKREQQRELENVRQELEDFQQRVERSLTSRQGIR